MVPTTNPLPSSSSKRQVWMARTLSDTLSTLLRSTNTTSPQLYLPKDEWYRLTGAAHFHGKVNLVSWNPLLESDEDRLIFEGLVNSRNSESPNNPSTQCFVCGNKDRGYRIPDHVVNFPGFGDYLCGDIELSGREGVIPETNCEITAQIAKDGGCDCVDIASNEDETEAEQVHDTIFRIDPTTGAIVDEPMGTAPYLPQFLVSSLPINQAPVMYNQLSNPIWKIGRAHV